MEQKEMTISTDHLNRAFTSTRALLDVVQPDQLGAPTPCASWDVRGLINHFVGSALWGAAALVGDDVAEEDFVAGDFRARYDESRHAALFPLVRRLPALHNGMPSCKTERGGDRCD